MDRPARHWPLNRGALMSLGLRQYGVIMDGNVKRVLARFLRSKMIYLNQYMNVPCGSLLNSSARLIGIMIIPRRLWISVRLSVLQKAFMPVLPNAATLQGTSAGSGK